jgi:hypothetical protein
MKKYTLVIVAIAFGITSFNIISNTGVQQTSILKKVANAHGFENWKNVQEIKFTFNVDRDTTHFERAWTWRPITNDITATSADGTVSYNWANMDSTAYKTNGGFINDKFWLLAPYQLVWDADNVTHTHIEKAEAPLSKKSMQKLTIVYGNEGGYTPGDAYDFYFEDDFLIQEWVFRKSNQPKPSMITTFEDYEEMNGLKIATMHKMDEGNFKLYFTGIEVK